MTLSYMKRITLSNLTRMMSMNNIIVISVKTLRTNSIYSLKKEFTKLNL